MHIKTVMVGVDGSDISRRAFDYATAMARRFAARLSVLEVIDWTLPPLASNLSTVSEMPADLQAAALEALNGLVEPARAVGVVTEICLETGGVVPQILRRAEAISADLLVVGTHGRSGFERLMLGSVAEKVLRKATCPVLTVPFGPGHPGDPPFRKILCGTDFSEASVAAVRAARGLAAELGATCLVAHVVHWPFGPEIAEPPAVAFRHSLEGQARDRLDRLVEVTAVDGGPAEAILATGEPARELLGIGDGYAIDLIVLGVSGHGAMNRAVIGSTTAAVLRQATCPVLTFRSGG
jgi:nucleotide-binding universal stress UspA family protein